MDTAVALVEAYLHVNGYFTVAEYPARVNAAMRDPEVLAVALTRFGCCPQGRTEALAHELLRHGRAVTPAGHTIRVVAFGDTQAPVHDGPWHTVPMDHVVRYLRDNWAVLRHAHLRDPAFAVLAVLEKWGVNRHDQGE